MCVCVLLIVQTLYLHRNGYCQNKCLYNHTKHYNEQKAQIHCKLYLFALRIILQLVLKPISVCLFVPRVFFRKKIYKFSQLNLW